MTVDQFWAKLLEVRGISFVSEGQDGNCNCMDCNQTPFEIPDPAIMPDDSREDMCNYILGHMDKHNIC